MPFAGAFDNNSRMQQCQLESTVGQLFIVVKMLEFFVGVLEKCENLISGVFDKFGCVC